MSFFKDYGVFHPDGSETTDIEEPPVVDLFCGNTPIGEPPDLLAKQIIQKIKTVRLFLSPVEDTNIFLNEIPDCVAFFMELI